MPLDPGGTRVPDMTAAEAAAMEQRDTQSSISQGLFANLQEQYDEACRTTGYLREALDSAQLREHILGGAIDRLNAPAQTSSLR